MDDLVRWLEDQLHDDERIAKAAMEFPGREEHLVPRDPGGRWLLPQGRWVHRRGDYGATVVADEAGRVIVPADNDQGTSVSIHIAEHDPMRVLEEVTAKTKLIAWALKQPADTTRKILRLIAETYRHRPGHQAEWRP
ncbi:DUF6221 family protein [Streptomyces sp. VRA16 Mangrove soil]|uniref:DUF6221 family protein n=1 Tax=Streptomyces sp. VRA16 Mangrove soil TaxID=2817434 RepID=UPI001A9E35EF|nr:DUF6221 family protein [Streptomyces sp. VRA16 Mangrove soil]MBO1330910.1 hypothetical protein [Streptomyces sp. VRA16 Mangrove soil]